MKKAWIAIFAGLLAFALLRAACSNQRLVNRLNPVWEIAGRVVSEQGKPISDVELQVSYLIGYYPVGRILEQSAAVERESIRPDATGFFSIRRQCDSIVIGIDDPRYELADTGSGREQVVFSRKMPRGHATSDTNLSIVLIARPINPVEPTSALSGAHRSP